jgi:hypothetical protein
MRALCVPLTLLAGICMAALCSGEPPRDPGRDRDDARRYPPPRADDRGGGEALVSAWIHQYLGRAPNRDDLLFGRQMDAGTRDAVTELAGIFGCDEYYLNRAGGDDRRFIETVFGDAAGRKPTEREREIWMRRLRVSPEGAEGRTDVAGELLLRYPPALPVLQPEDPYDYRSRRPYDRDRERERDRDRK